MATNDFLKYGDSIASENILDDSTYAASSRRDTGVFEGDKTSIPLHNKVVKQISTFSTGISEFIANNQATDVDDSMTQTQYLTAFLSAMSMANFTTQPQFDDGQNVATCGFVQRAIGTNSKSVVIVAANYSITTADVGAELNTEVGCTLTLPLISDLIAAGASGQGVKFKIINGASTSTINAQAPDTINAGFDGTALTTFTLEPYEAVEISNVNGAVDGNWVITGGSAQSSGTGSFESQYTVSGSGFQTLPGGLVMNFDARIDPTFGWNHTPIPGFYLKPYSNNVLTAIVGAQSFGIAAGYATASSILSIDNSQISLFISTNNPAVNLGGSTIYYSAVLGY